MGILGQFGLTILAAFLGAWIAMKRFRVERWWEKKAEAYIDLVEALHEMSMVPAEHFNAGVRGRDLSDEQQSALWDSFKQSRRKVWKIADSADFIISSEVAAAIQRLNQGLSDSDDAVDFYDHLLQIESATNKCLAEVKAIGAEELGIKKGRGWRGWLPGGIKKHIDDFKFLSKHL